MNAASTEIKSPFSGPRADLGKRAPATDTVIIVTAIVGGLYFGRDVLVPMALAVLLSFVLAPVVIALGRLHLGNAASVLATVIVAFGLLALWEPSSANSFRSSPRICLNTRSSLARN